MEIQAESQMQSRMVQAQQIEEQFDPLEFDRFTRLQELTRFVAESINDVATVQQNLMKNVDEADAALLAQRRVARSLQDELMGVRLVPFSSLSDRLYRVARLTAREAGKRVNVDIKGAQVELDRSVLERIAAPLEHLLRNAIVHGIEAPEVRQAAGKPETGEVAVQVRQEGNEVLVTFSDDGRGLDLARIREKALHLSLLPADAVVPDADLAQLIFAPGFSTAAQVSQAAGRGVGLDVVRSEITDLGGRVEVNFTPERGTTFLVYLPLTLAVMQALLVRSGGQLFALPTLMIENVQKVREADLERLYTAGEVIWQERRYPLCHLQHLLADPEYVPRLRRYNAVVLMRSGPQRVAIHVDEFVGNQEIVVKNIGAQLTRVTGIAGAAVIGNGDSVLIINPVVLGERAGTAGEACADGGDAGDAARKDDGRAHGSRRDGGRRLADGAQDHRPAAGARRLRRGRGARRRRGAGETADCGSGRDAARHRDAAHGRLRAHPAHARRRALQEPADHHDHLAHRGQASHARHGAGRERLSRQAVPGGRAARPHRRVRGRSGRGGAALRVDPQFPLWGRR